MTGFICPLLEIYSYIILARILLSYVRATPGTTMAQINGVLLSLTEPVLGPLRRVIPPVRMGAGAIDLSPIIVFVGIMLICG